jgi:hypoxanthine phosphoribosyltransferase
MYTSRKSRLHHNKIFKMRKYHLDMSNPIDLRGNSLINVDQLVIPEAFKNDVKGIMIPEGYVKDRINKLGDEISQNNYHGDILALCMLNGAMNFYGDLIKQIKHPVQVETIRVQSYVGTESSGHVEISGYDLSNVKGRDLLIVEDIIDTGRTLNSVNDQVRGLGANSVKIVSLLDKPSRRLDKVTLKPDYVGFTIDDEFVVGCGLDYNGRYRDVPHICVLKEEIYK